jgi:hypothetical protein
VGFDGMGVDGLGWRVKADYGMEYSRRGGK